jgi:orotate phosphoribosyltransferase/AMMECR1 domain-containing protein
MSTVVSVRRGSLSSAGEMASTAGSERDELLELLRSDGILYRTETQPVVSRDGSSARWMLDSLSVTLTQRGGHLAAYCLLELLQSFEARQLVTYGLTGVPLLQGCVLYGGGRYQGALVRKERKTHGSLKLIEGRLDRSEPVVIVDDSVSSACSMWTCVRELEKEGFQVEGGVSLVRFCYERGTAKMLQRGYRMAAVFDIYEDFIQHMDGEAPYILNPTKNFGTFSPSLRRAVAGLHPTRLARDVIVEYVRSGQALGVPAKLDRSYDSSGGCWVSLRRRSDIHDRPARSGFWHFSGESRGGAEQDVVLASIRTAQQLIQIKSCDILQLVEECAIAVTFFSELEPCAVGQLDNERYGIVVRSLERPPQMGGALPRMPGISTEWEQFCHAWRRNAQLFPFEPFQLYRHRVQKVVEPGVEWQPTGTAAPVKGGWHDRPGLGLVATRARESVLHELGISASTGEAGVDSGSHSILPREVVAAFVTIYANGRIAGCAGGFGEDIESSLHGFAVAAAQDTRFVQPRPDDNIAVSVSLLFNRHEIGVADPEWVVQPTRFADQALRVRQGNRMGIVLPFVAVTNNLSPLGYVREVIDKAGITRPPYRWTRYDCVTWLADDRDCRRLRHGLPEGEPAPSSRAQLVRLHDLLLSYTRRHHLAQGQSVSRYEVFADRVRTSLHPARLAYGAWIKARAGLHREAWEDLNHLESGQGSDGWIDLDAGAPSISELAFVVLARAELGADVKASVVVTRLWSQIDLHGRFATHRDASAADAAYRDYAPGQALLALACAVQRGGEDFRSEELRRALRYYRMRFCQNHHWGAVAWLTPAFSDWGLLLKDSSLIGFAYEITDWALQFQSDKTGGFLNDHQIDSPGATTALYLETLARIRATAEIERDTMREQRYRVACERALHFLDRLVYQERDSTVVPNLAAAIGGLRTSLTASDVRTDYVHHALGATIGLRPMLAEAGDAL